MTAKEMFKELGYEEVKGYSMKIYMNDKYRIMFWTPVNIEIGTKMISAQLLKAINKQIEELGWNNENN